MTEAEEEQGVSREIYQLEMICALISVDRETYLVSSRGRRGRATFDTTDYTDFFRRKRLATKLLNDLL